jgi:hypothetical protein
MKHTKYKFICILLDFYGRILLRWMFRKWEVDVGTVMELVQDRDRWQALVSTVKNLRFP